MDYEISFSRWEIYEYIICILIYLCIYVYEGRDFRGFAKESKDVNISSCFFL